MAGTQAERHYDEQYVKWVVDLSQASLRDAEQTLTLPSALLGVLVFVLGTNVEALLLDAACPLWLHILVATLVVEGVVSMVGSAIAILRSLHGPLVATILSTEPASEFISDYATRYRDDVACNMDRCHELAVSRALLDDSADRVVRHRGAAYMRAVGAIGWFLGARVLIAGVGC